MLANRAGCRRRSARSATGGGSLAIDMRRGSMTLKPSKGKNHSLPSGAFVTFGPNGPALARLRTRPSCRTPSIESSTARLAFRPPRWLHASSSVRVILPGHTAWTPRDRRRYPPSSNELRRRAVRRERKACVARPLFNRLTPPSAAAQSAPSLPKRRSLIRPGATPSAAVYEAPNLTILHEVDAPAIKPQPQAPVEGSTATASA